MSMNIALTLCYNFVDVEYLTFTTFNRFADAYHLLRVIVMHTLTSERSCADNLRFITFRGMYTVNHKKTWQFIFDYNFG